MKRRAMVTVLGGLTMAACGQGEAGGVTAPLAQNDAGAATAAAGKPSETRTFRDWTAVCDNGDDCVAYGPATEGATGWVRIGLSPGPQATPEVRVGFWPEGPQELTGPATVSLDGRAMTATTPGDGSGGLMVPGGLATARSIANGRSLSVTGAGQTVTMNLNGAAAALLWIDERQGRLDTPTALVRVGNRPAGTVPAGPPLPRVVAAPAVDQGDYGRSTADENSEGMALPPALAALPAVAQCRENLSFRPGMMDGVQAAKLSGGKELWMIPCDAGAYNLITIQFLTDVGGANPQPLRLPGSDPQPDSEVSTDLELINAGYDPASRQIGAFAKGRGIGDCGVSATWTWSGRAFVLTGESVMGNCIGMTPELWPTTWRTRE